METREFDYILPTELIAQHSLTPRDHSRLMVVDRGAGAISDTTFYGLPELLRPGDLLVFNDSKVFKARLRAQCDRTSLEVFLLREKEAGVWEALAKPARKIPLGGIVRFEDGLSATLLERSPDGVLLLQFPIDRAAVFAYAEQYGEIPTPPYVTEAPEEAEQYQTLYARQVGSVAAPTAGFHFTRELFRRLEARGVKTAYLTLHVGLGTFRPIQSEKLEDHIMHEEYFEIPEETRKAIEDTKKKGGRVIAVGTTTLRALESPDIGKTSIFITPGYQFTVVDALITNFHLPKSTLLVLVSAFANIGLIREAYMRAIRLGYRFYSFGDAMLIL